MNIDYNLYKIFLYLYEEKSISKTANKLYVSQPAISYSLKELESQLGYTLFNRNSKGIEPTIEAKELYQYISTAFHILSDAEEHIKNLNNLSVGCIRIGVVPYLNCFFFMESISQFRKMYPGVRFEIVSKDLEEMIGLLQMRKLDFIIGGTSVLNQKDVTKVNISKFTNCFAYKKNSSISIKNTKDLFRYPFILPNLKSDFGSKVVHFLENQGLEVEDAIEVFDMNTMLEMVRQGMGVGYFLKEFLENQTDYEAFEIVEFPDFPKTDIACIYIEDYLTTASQKFMDVFMKQVG